LQEDVEDFKEDNTEKEEEMVTEIASKCVRFFTASHPQDNNHFAVFVESGFDREVDTTVSDDHTEVYIHIKMPTPPDALVQSAGFHATNVPLEETNQVFTVHPPKRLASKHRELIEYHPPEHPVTTWFIFKYEFEEEVVEEKMVARSIDIAKLFSKNSDPTKAQVDHNYCEYNNS
jgi:hypothetical protein